MKNRTVTIESGELEGIFGWDPRILVFKGVPYAAPPVGDLRWKAPQPAKSWEGVRRADQYGPMACQPQPGENPEDFWTREFHPTATEFEMSEDCLYLNIFTPARNGDEKLPVFCYSHGGGYKGGYPYEVEFDWEHMARKGMVCVAITYRLGIMGFLAHPELAAEQPGSPVGNYGVLDQLCALKWVKRNIAAFGGNPEQITIAGQSAGSGSVQCQLTSPMARGIFAGAVIESGVTIPFCDVEDPLSPIPLAKALDNGAEFFEKAKIGSLEEARRIPARELIDRAEKIFGRTIRFQPVVDGIYLKETFFEAMKHGNWPDIPIMTGYNVGELEMFRHYVTGLPETVAELPEFADKYEEYKEKFLSLCTAATDEELREFMQGDAWNNMKVSARICAEILSGMGRKAYLYQFDADIPGEDHPGSFHGAELWFAYDSLARSWRPFTGKHYDLARQVSSYWANFIKTGNPNGNDNFGNALPGWTAYRAESRKMMCFEETAGERDVELDGAMELRWKASLITPRESGMSIST